MPRQGKNKTSNAGARPTGQPGIRASAHPAPAHPHHLINAKLKPPPAAVWVEREALLAAIDRASCKKLVLLAAPIGSGKTTLLGQWYRHAIGRRAIAWLSLDEQDNGPARFFSYLIGALRAAVDGFDAYIASPIEIESDPPLEPVVALFLESLNRVERDVVVVLDDFQCITDPALARAFAYVLQRSASNVHWIISSRQSPALDLSRLKLQDQLVVIGVPELNFAAADIARLGRKLCGIELAPADADSIQARTEGWIAGAKLALLSAADPAHAGESLGRFTGSHCDVVRYLGDAVLRDQPPQVREFLLASAIVDKLNGDLCDALLGIENGQAMLEYLEKSQLFIQPLDSHRQWYRYHALFLEFLRSCLRRDMPGRVAQLHGVASRWFAEHQMIEEALTHAFAAGERGWCIELTARYARAWLAAGEITEVLRWSARLTQTEILNHGDICTTYIASLILARRFADATDALRAAAHVGSGGATAARLKVLNLMLAILADSADDGAVTEDMTPVQDRADAFLAGILLTLQAYRCLRQNRFDVARRVAMRARDIAREIGSVYGIGYAEVVVCLADRAQGDVKAAADNCERVFATVNGGRRNPAWVNAATALAHVRYEQNRLAEAEALCVEALPLLSVASTIENFTVAYVTLARIKSTNGRHAEAFQLLDYAHSVLENGDHQRFLAQVCYEKIRLCLLQGNGARAHAVAEDFRLPELAARCEWQVAREYEEAWERYGFAQAALLLHERRYAECQSLLEVLRDSARRVGYVYREIPLEAALAACHWRAGAADAAFSALNRGFALAPRSGFTRGVFDEVPDLQAVIAAAVKTNKLRYLLPTKYFKKFGDIFANDRDGAPPPEIRRRLTLPLEPLTERELDMLKLLAQGLSNKEISRSSRIALSTTKWHLKNVFAKLDVTTRTGAIVRARELQLIERV